MDREFAHPETGLPVTYATIQEALRDQGIKTFPMILGSHVEIQAVADAVNQGIDSHLEACFVRARGDNYEVEDVLIGNKAVHRRLNCHVSAESLPVLLRRLTEQANSGEGENSREIDMLVSAALEVLGIDGSGRYQKPE